MNIFTAIRAKLENTLSKLEKAHSRACCKYVVILNESKEYAGMTPKNF
jgi:hypothetical protein